MIAGQHQGDRQLRRLLVLAFVVLAGCGNATVSTPTPALSPTSAPTPTTSSAPITAAPTVTEPPETASPTLASTVTLGPTPASTVAQGPPFPDPEPGTFVYDTAGVFRLATVTSVEATIRAIRARTGVEIVVYTQVVNPAVSTIRAEADAQDLMNQWRVGRAGFDDGLVILFDLDASKVHGQVQLYAGAGYSRAYLGNAQRQSI